MDTQIINTIASIAQIEISEALFRLQACGMKKEELAELLTKMVSSMPEKPIFSFREDKIIKPKFGNN